MSYSDKHFGDVFPVRNGEATGSANERQMLDAVGGSGSFRTRIQDHADGSTTTLRTKNGMPQFSTNTVIDDTKDTPKNAHRTFMFSDRAAPTVGRVANWNPLRRSFAIVLNAITIAANVAYSVLSVRSATKLQSLPRGRQWRDVIRLDDKAAKLNAEDFSPISIDYATILNKPGLPYLLPSNHQDPALSRLCLGLTDDFVPGIDTARSYVVGVSTIAVDGTVANILPVPWPFAFDPDKVAGARLTNGVFHFYWQGIDTAAPLVTLTNHAVITPRLAGLPLITGTAQTATNMPPYSFPSVNYSMSSPSDSDTVVSGYYRWVVYQDAGMVFSGSPHLYSLTQKQTLGGYTPAYTSVRTTTWQKSVSFNETNAVGDDVCALTVVRYINGHESSTVDTGGPGTNPRADYTPPSGSKTDWTRVVETLVTVKLDVADVFIYEDNMIFTSKMIAGECLLPTVSWNWGDFDSTTEWGTPYFFIDNADAAYNTNQHSQFTAWIASQNAAQISVANSFPTDQPLEIGGILKTTTYPAAAVPNSFRDDAQDFKLRSRDYVFYDVDEDISLYLTCEVLMLRTNRIIPAPSIFDVTDWYANGSASIEIKYVLNVRGVISVYPVYMNPNCWEPVFNTGYVSGSALDPELWENKFSGCNIPKEPSITFTPPYMAQGRCPWIAYTTKDEESHGVTPEFYLDVKLSPLMWGRGYVDIDPLGSPTQFVAHQLTRVFANYMGLHAPYPDMWDRILFPTPTHIRFATGISDPWPAALGAPFSASSEMVITRI